MRISAPVHELEAMRDAVFVALHSYLLDGNAVPTLVGRRTLARTLARLEKAVGPSPLRERKK